MKSEEQLREQVRNLKAFYTNLVIYGGVSAACILVWIMTGGYFWPIWPIVAFVIMSLIQGIKLGTLPMLEDIFPFLSPDWEQKQVECMKDSKEKPRASASSEAIFSPKVTPKATKKTKPSKAGAAKKV